jgi:hypothetical protein
MTLSFLNRTRYDHGSERGGGKDPRSGFREPCAHAGKHAALLLRDLLLDPAQRLRRSLERLEARCESGNRILELLDDLLETRVRLDQTGKLPFVFFRGCTGRMQGREQLGSFLVFAYAFIAR